MDEASSLVISEGDNDWVAAARFVNLVLGIGKGVLWARTSFTDSSRKGRNKVVSSAGSYVIPFGDPLDYAIDKTMPAVSRTRVERMAKALGIKTRRVSQNLDAELLRLRPTRVALSADGGSPYPFAAILSTVGIEYAPLTGVDIRNDELENFNVFVIPGGGAWGGSAIQTGTMGEAGRRKVRDWVHRGGAIWGSCGGCMNMIRIPEGAKSHAIEDSPGFDPPRRWPKAQSLDVLNAEYWSRGASGVGKLVGRNLRPDHPVMLGLPNEFEITWHLGPFLSPTPGRVEEASDPIPLLQMKGASDEWTSLEYAYNPTKQSEPGALEKTYVGRGFAEGRLGIIAGYYGLGKVCGSGGHPEFGLEWLLEKWGLPARMFVNFVFWANSQTTVDRHDVKSGQSVSVGKTETLSTVKYSHEKLRLRLDLVSSKVRKLSSKPLDPLPGWLRDEAAEATFGLTARVKWPRILERLRALPAEINDASLALQKLDSELRVRLAKAERLSRRIRMAKEPLGSESEQHLIRQALRLILQELTEINEAYNYCRPPEWTQDFGWQGAIAQIDSAITKLDRALTSYGMRKKSTGFDSQAPLKPLFIGMDDSPYNLVWGWYLGALYDVINTLTVIRGRQVLAARKLTIVEYLLDHASGDALRVYSQQI